MDEMLSQEEINALLRGIDDDDSNDSKLSLSEVEKDSIGEVSNISMGTAATTLYSLINQKVVITTPKVTVASWSDIVEFYDAPFVTVQIVYKEGLTGSNLMILKEEDAKIIADCMMGGEGIAAEGELNELHLSAVSEAMNQMIGSAATSMSSMFDKKIDIQPPISNYIDNKNGINPKDIAEFLNEEFIKVTFDLEIGNIIKSEMMQLYAPDIAKEVHEAFLSSQETQEPPVEEVKNQEPQVTNDMSQVNVAQGQNQDTGIPQQGNPAAMGGQPYGNPQQPMGQPYMGGQPMGGQPYMGGQPMGGQPYMAGQPMGGQPMGGQPYMGGQSQQDYRNIEVQQAQFQNLNMNNVMQQKENINLIMDVPLEVTVELGRTHKPIKDILDFAPGTIIELNKLAGEPIDILVNGKIVANGEVVVIDENFGIRITDIVKQINPLI